MSLRGDNVIPPSARMPWYAGPTLMQHLDTLPLAARVTSDEPFRLPVQWVNRPHLNFRGYAGSIASGEIRVGERVRVLPSGRRAASRRSSRNAAKATSRAPATRRRSRSPTRSTSAAAT